MARSTLYEKFLAFVRKNRLFAPGERVLLGCSGGPDSMALLDILARCRDRGLIALSVCHLDHSLRGEDSRRDAAFVEETASKLGVAVQVARKNVRLIAHRRGLSIEAAARQARYGFFRRAARRAGAAKVATAHTQSDNAETVLQRIIEGAGPEGLRGIPLVRTLGKRNRIQIVRPLLFATRGEIEQYTGARRLPSRLDRTNLEPIYLRNRIRLEILPLLKELNPSIEHALSRIGKSVGALLDFAGDDVAAALDRIRRPGPAGTTTLDRTTLLSTHPALAAEVIKHVLLAAGLVGRTLSSKHIEAILSLAGGRQPSAALDLPGELSAWRDYARVVIGRRDLEPQVAAFRKSLRVPGRITLPNGLGKMECRLLKRFRLDKFLSTKTRNVEVIDAGKIRGALVVRPAEPGERFRGLGAPGARKLQDFFVDEKVPRARRASTPVVADASGIIYVAGMRIADRVKVTGKTRSFLRLKWTGPERSRR